MKSPKLSVKKRIVFKLNNELARTSKGRTTLTDMTVTSIIDTVVSPVK